jgi:nitrate reductase NapA
VGLGRYYDVNVDQQLFEEYRRFTRLKHKDLAPYDEYVKAPAGCAGRWCEDATALARDALPLREGDDPYVEAGKGFQFYHSTTKDDRAQVWFHPTRTRRRSPTRSTRSGCAPAACSSTGTRAR